MSYLALFVLLFLSIEILLIHFASKPCVLIFNGYLLADENLDIVLD